MKTVRIIILLFVASTLLVETIRAERFCGNALGQFVSVACSHSGGANLKSMKYKLLLYKFVRRYIGDMSREDKAHLVEMFSRNLLNFPTRSDSRRVTRSSTRKHSATTTNGHCNPAIPAPTNQTVEQKNIVDLCCHQSCDINTVRDMYCRPASSE